MSCLHFRVCQVKCDEPASESASGALAEIPIGGSTTADTGRAVMFAAADEGRETANEVVNNVTSGMLIDLMAWSTDTTNDRGQRCA